jgi:predicted nuclease of restriction endonuclease-like (RecB) superfamily
MRGLAPRSLEYMQTFASVWPEPIAQQPVARLPWGHITVLLDRLDDHQVRQWYAAQDVQHVWSRSVLRRHIDSGRHLRVGAADTTR